MLAQFSKLRCLIGTLSLTLFVANPVWADDTEIFFGRSSTDIQPNVLFILDASGSMNLYDCADPSIGSQLYSCNDGTPNGTTTRQERMQSALISVINNLTDVNVGLMRFSEGESGGRITYPITDIDQQFCGDQPCADNTIFSTESAPASSSDDAVQHTNGDVITTDTEISLTSFEDASTENQWIGLRFPGLLIPQGATITDARLDFTSVSDSNSNTNLTIHAEETDNAQPFTSDTNNIGQRQRHFNSVSWGSIPEWKVSGSYESPNIAELLQPVVNDNDWCGGNAVGLILSGNGQRGIVAYDTDADNAPKLRVSYKLDQVPDNGGCTTSTLLTGVSNSLDDGSEQNVSGPDLTSSVIRVASSGSGPSSTSAIRFSDVNIPPDANIINASITLTTAANNSDSDQDSGQCSAPTNIASNGTASQSSGYRGDRFPASLAIDGNLDSGNFTHTRSKQTPATWSLAFDNDNTFNEIKLFNRGNCCGDRLRDITVSVLDASDSVIYQSELLNPGNTLNSPDSITVDLPADISGRKIQVERTPYGAANNDDTTVLSLREVQVQGCALNSNESSPLEISAHDSANPGELETSNGNISNRTDTSAVDWNDIPTTGSTKVTTPSLTNIVQNLVNKGNWSNGNSMVFLFKEGGQVGHSFVSYDGSTTEAPQLRIEFESRTLDAEDQANEPVTDVRTQIIAEVNDIHSGGGTPTLGALLEARRYFAGESVLYGLNRNADRSEVGHPRYRGRFSRVSTPSSYTGGGEIIRDPNCNINNPNGKFCASEAISGNPVYISPHTHECQANHIVLLTDGLPNIDPVTVDRFKNLASTDCITPPGSNDGRGTCGAELANYLSKTDQISATGDQFITTHTVGFNFASQWLEDVASAGEGKFFPAESSNQLSTVLLNILDSVHDTGSTFVAPGATVDNFSRISHRNDIYLALFQPGSTPDWAGNLKRYDFSGNPAVLRDATGAAALDPDTGNFSETAHSAWPSFAGDGNDGSAITKGGAAGRILPANRKVYTNNGSSNLLTHETNKFGPDNNLITTDQLGLLSADTATRADIMNWTLGYDIKDEDGDSNTTEARFHIGDPLHSRPAIITYGGDSLNPDSVIYFGTNDGFLHAISTETGDEVFSFIPSELIPNLKRLYDSEPAADKIYGLDGAISLWTNDENNNGIIESDDHVFLYAGMRRGGNSYYALDITDQDFPILKWQISNATSGFEELGQTWSEALPTSINYLGTETNVLVFGGGYDPDQDDHTTRTHDDIGRSIYIVDADSGVLLWSGGPTGGSETRSFSDMTYSFPASAKAVDANGDGMSEQIYIGDVGGRIWRFDINENTQDVNDLVEGGIIADMGTDGVLADNRRFYHTPDISVSSIHAEKFINVAVGSGFQAHPLDTAIEDRFYLIRYPFISPEDEDGNLQYGIAETSFTSDGDDSALSPNTSYTPILEEHLFNATSNIISEGSPEEIDAAEKALADSHGWFIEMEKDGEKVLGSSITFDNKVLFASYFPGESPNICSPEIGSGNFYAVNLYDATPALDLDSADEEGGNLNKKDRTRTIPGGGIAAPIQTLFIESGNKNEDGTVENKKLQILAISGANKLATLDSKDLVKRVYWSEYPNF